MIVIRKGLEISGFSGNFFLNLLLMTEVHKVNFKILMICLQTQSCNNSNLCLKFSQQNN
jgi:hypothetical protein